MLMFVNGFFRVFSFVIFLQAILSASIKFGSWRLSPSLKAFTVFSGDSTGGRPSLPQRGGDLGFKAGNIYGEGKGGNVFLPQVEFLTIFQI